MALSRLLTGSYPGLLDVSNGPLKAAKLSLDAQYIPIICVAQLKSRGGEEKRKEAGADEEKSCWASCG